MQVVFFFCNWVHVAFPQVFPIIIVPFFYIPFRTPPSQKAQENEMRPAQFHGGDSNFFWLCICHASSGAWREPTATEVRGLALVNCSCARAEVRCWTVCALRHLLAVRPAQAQAPLGHPLFPVPIHGRPALCTMRLI